MYKHDYITRPMTFNGVHSHKSELVVMVRFNVYQGLGEFTLEEGVRLVQIVQPDPVREPHRMIGVFERIVYGDEE